MTTQQHKPVLPSALQKAIKRKAAIKGRARALRRRRPNWKAAAAVAARTTRRRRKERVVTKKKFLLLRKPISKVIKELRYPCSGTACPSKAKTYTVDFWIQSDSLDTERPIQYTTSMSNKKVVDQLKKMSRTDKMKGTRWSPVAYTGPEWARDAYVSRTTTGAWRQNKPRHSQKDKQAWKITVPHSPLGSPYTYPITGKNKEWRKLKGELEKRMKVIFKRGNILHIPNPMYPKSRAKDIIFKVRSYDWPPLPQDLLAPDPRHPNFFKKSPFGFIVVSRGSEMVISALVYLDGSVITPMAEKALLLKGPKEQLALLDGVSRTLHCNYHTHELQKWLRDILGASPRAGAYGVRRTKAETTEEMVVAAKRARRGAGRKVARGGKRTRRRKRWCRRKTRRRRNRE